MKSEYFLFSKNYDVFGAKKLINLFLEAKSGGGWLLCQREFLKSRL